MQQRTRSLLVAAALATGLHLPAAPGQRGLSTLIELGAVAGDANTQGFIMPGFATGDLMGNSVAMVGDVNGDGLADFAVGRPFFATYSGYTAAAGSVFVVFGKADGVSVDPQAIATDANNDGFVIRGDVYGASHQAGFSVSGAGDVNGDGLDDIVLGAPTCYVYGGFGPGRGKDGAERGTYGNRGSGAAFVVFGKSDGTQVDLDSLQLNGDARGFAFGDANSTDPNKGIGFSVSGAGDVNGDGFDDIVVGVRNYDPFGCFRADGSDDRGVCPPYGAAAVVFGKNNGNFVDIGFVANPVNNLGFLIHAVESYDGTGFSVAGAGDVNGDGLADVIVGVPQQLIPARGSQTGDCAYVVFGKDDSNTVFLDNVANDLDSSGFVMRTLDLGGRAGASVDGAGDVNGDGLGDVIVGDFNTFGYGRGQGAENQRGLFNYARPGRSFVVFGKADGVQVSLTSDVTYGSAGFMIQGNYSEYTGNGIASGRSVSSAGDVDGDGFFDLIVGAPKADYAYYYNYTPYYGPYYGRSGGGRRQTVVFGGDSNEGETKGEERGGMGFYYYNVGRSFIVFGKPDATNVALGSIQTGAVDGIEIEGESDFSDYNGFFSGFSVSGNLVGDMNGDGLSDVAIGAPGFAPYTYNAPSDTGRSYVVFSPRMPDLLGIYLLHTRSGDGPGGGIVPQTRFGDVARVKLDFSDDDFGTGPLPSRGAGNFPSEETVTILRTTAVLNLAPVGQESEVAKVLWRIQTDRVAWNNVVVTLKYIDSEIAEMTSGEAEFVIYRADSPSGPWLALPTVRDPQRNEVSTSVNGPDTASLGFFAIAGTFMPLYVDLTSFAADSDGAGSPIVVSWETSAEINSVGFHVYAADPDGSGGWTKGERLTDSLVVAQGGPTTGASYAFVDPDELDSDSEARAYFLEDIDTGGRATLHGPAILSIRGIPAGVTDWKRFE